MTDLNQKPSESKVGRGEMINLAMDLGLIIALPLVALGFLGKYLDGRFDTKPWITLAGILLAIVITTLWLSIKFSKYLRNIYK
jgi:hypothetical protein